MLIGQRIVVIGDGRSSRFVIASKIKSGSYFKIGTVAADGIDTTEIVDGGCGLALRVVSRHEGGQILRDLDIGGFYGFFRLCDRSV